MITNVDPQAAMFLASLNIVQNSLAQASQQVSSGLKINVASDAPDQIGTLLQLRANLQKNTQIQSNLTLAQTDANAADSALQSSIQLMDSAVSLATQGASATLDASSRATIAQQVQSIEQQMVSNSQTTVQGRFIFSGDDDGSPEYQWDATATNPAVAQFPAGTTPQATHVLEDPAGGTFPTSLTAQQIFDDLRRFVRAHVAQQFAPDFRLAPGPTADGKVITLNLGIFADGDLGSQKPDVGDEMLGA